MLGILVALKSILEFDAVATTISAASAGVTVSDLFDKLKSACKDDSIEYQTIQVLDRSLKEACIELGWAYDKLVVSETIDLGRMPDISVMTDSGLKNLFSKFVREEIDDDSLKVIIECFDKNVAENDKIHRYLDQKWKRYQNEKKSSSEIVQVVEKKHFTNKNLIAPFTREDSNAAQGGTYVQRDDLLEKIENGFEEQIGKKRMVFLTGMGGCGKSELARAFADRHKDKYEEIFWLTCKDGIKPSLMDLISESKTLCEVKREDAASFSEEVLIIVDNCNTDDEKFLSELSKETGKADILITTRMPHMGSYEHTIPVESDDKDVFAYSVFEKNYCKKSRWRKLKKIDESEVESVREICREVQYNTMMVSLIGIRLREHSDLSVTECVKKIRNGVGRLNGNIKYSKDQQPRSEEIREILDFLFSDILNYPLSIEQKEILTVLSLTPAYWYDIDFISSLCRGTRTDTDYEDAAMTLLDLGWLQGGEDRMAIHPLVAEVLSTKEPIINESSFIERLLDNYLGISEQYICKEKVLINKILMSCKNYSLEKEIAVMLLINHGGYKKTFAGIHVEVTAAYFVYVVHDEKRYFFYRDLKKETTALLTCVRCQTKEGNRAELLKKYIKDSSYSLDLSVSFLGKFIEEIPDGLCFEDHFIRKCVFSENTKYIGMSSFQGCSGMSGELKLPNDIVCIGDSAFYGCSGLSGVLTLPKSLTRIGKWAFFRCSGLQGVSKFPDSIETISEWTFGGCSGLIGELQLPDSIERIEDSAFRGCNRLSGKLGLPNSLKTIGENAFSGCSGLKELSLPKGLKSIGFSAFSDCVGLSGELNLPDGLTDIGGWAFCQCSHLSGNLRLPKCLTDIEDWTFHSCSGLNGELILPDDLINIGDSAFFGCSSLHGNLKLPGRIEIIGSMAFLGCSGLSGKLEIPEGLKIIGDLAFQGCSGLTGELKLPNSLTSIGYRPFSGCTGLSGKQTLSGVEESIEGEYTGLSGELRLPEDLKIIASKEFEGCYDLRGRLKLPKSLMIIGDKAFSGCFGFSGELNLPDGITSIGYSAFSECFGLSGDLNLPESLTNIGGRAFYKCSGLSGNLKIPDGLKNIGAEAFHGCCGFNGKLTLPREMTKIENAVFKGCSRLSGELMLPDNLTIIGNRAFYGCSMLKGKLYLSDNIISIGADAFAGCCSLNGQLKLPKNMKSINSGTFLGCSGLSGELKLPENLEIIEKNAFFGCSGISGELEIPNSLKSIGDSAFSGCSGLCGDLKIPRNLMTIGESAFLRCNSIERITFYNEATIIKGSLNLYSSTIICGYRNSTAEEYARKYGLVFEELKPSD